MRFKATDPSGDTGSLDLVIEVTGVNNPPEVDTPQEVRIKTTDKAVEGQIVARDVDEDARLGFEVLGDKRPEGFTLSTDGRWRFDPAQGDYKILLTGEFRSFFVPVKVSDEMGGMTIARLQITVEGSQ